MPDLHPSLVHQSAGQPSQAVVVGASAVGVGEVDGANADRGNDADVSGRDGRDDYDYGARAEPH